MQAPHYSRDSLYRTLEHFGLRILDCGVKILRFLSKIDVPGSPNSWVGEAEDVVYPVFFMTYRALSSVRRGLNVGSLFRTRATLAATTA